ncbi:MAG: ribonuclease Z [Planctomycetia bacterium]|nr:ribonuclease Z [Planctomycetia bacterium]
MSLAIQVLGRPGRDNALLVTVNSGQAMHRLLFDCGDGCLDELPFADVQGIDHLFFSHLHMDHVAGFDTFFRCNYNRTARENHIWGPTRTAAILHHRFQGYLWNLVAGQQASWQVHDLTADRIDTTRFELAEAFAQPQAVGGRERSAAILTGVDYSVEAYLMNHGTPSVAYVVRESPRINIDTARLAQLGLRPGPWLQRIRGPAADPDETITVDGTARKVRALQDHLRTVAPREAVAYLTDFLLDERASEQLGEVLRGVATVVCECQYREADRELAQRNYHMTSTQTAMLARRAGVGRLVLFHLSDRYRPLEWREMLREAQAIFPAACFPEHWSFAET